MEESSRRRSSLNAFIRGTPRPELLRPAHPGGAARLHRGRHVGSIRTRRRTLAGLAIFRYETRCGTVYGHTGNFPATRSSSAASRDGALARRPSRRACSSGRTLDAEVFAELRHTFELAVCAALGRVRSDDNADPEVCCATEADAPFPVAGPPSVLGVGFFAVHRRRSLRRTGAMAVAMADAAGPESERFDGHGARATLQRSARRWRRENRDGGGTGLTAPIAAAPDPRLTRTSWSNGACGTSSVRAPRRGRGRQRHPLADRRSCDVRAWR